MAKKDYDSIFKGIINQIIETQISVRKLIKYSEMGSTKFFEMLDNTEYANQYARAMAIRAETMAFEILEISDDSSNDTICTEKGDFENKEWVNRSRLRVDSRKWLLSKMLPKKYGDKVGVEHSGSIENKSDLSKLTTQELIDRAKAIQEIKEDESSD